MVDRIQARPKENWTYYVADECRARLYPTVSKVWAPRGVFPEIPLLDVHGSCAVFGMVDLHTGQTLSHVAKSLSGAEQLQLLEQVAARHPPGRVLILWDNGPTHRNKKVAAWLAEHPNVKVFWLPPYAGERVNPIERLWKWFRECVTHNHLFLELEPLMEAARDFFRQFAADRKAVLARLG